MQRYLVKLAYPGTIPPEWDYQTYVQEENSVAALRKAYGLCRLNHTDTPDQDRITYDVQEVRSVREGDVELPAQKEYIQNIESKCASLLAGKLDGKFRMVNYPAGFHYGITWGPDAYYNAATLSDLDSTICEGGKTGQLVLSGNRYSNLYYQILDTAGYAYSKNDQKIMEDESTAAQAQIATVIKEFENAHGKYTDPLPFGGKIADIITQMYKAYGKIENMPSPLAALRNAIEMYEHKAKQSSIMLDRWYHAQCRLDSAKENTKAPSKANGGQQTGDNSFFVGFSPERLPTANQLLGSLKTDSNKIAINLSMTHFDSHQTSLVIENSVSIVIPIAGIIDIAVERSSSYTLSKYISHYSSVGISIEYPGITLVPGIASGLSTDNSAGWYDSIIVDQIAKNTGNDATGIRLMGSEFDVKELFGEGGRFARLKTFVISQQPTIRMVMNKVDVASVVEDLKERDKVTVTLFGFITLGSHEHNYSVRDVEQNSQSQSVTVTFGPPEVSGTTPLEQQVACLIGGVPIYPPYNS